MEARRLASLAAHALTLCLLASSAAAKSEPAEQAVSAAMRDLEGSHDQGLAAIETLTTAAKPGLARLARDWDRLSPKAQRRAVQVLERLAERHGDAVALLVRAASSDDPQLQRDALRSLGRSGPRGSEGLALLLSSPEVGDRAARQLARQSPEHAMPMLLAALQSEHASGRPGLRDAIHRSAKRGGPEARQALGTWLQSNPQAPALAGAALALSGSAEHSEFVTACIETGATQAADFDARWRFVLSARTATASPKVDAWLLSLVSDASEWMLRDAAIEALAQRGHREAARQALHDPYPRVRASASETLAGDPETTLERARLARRDRWPMVRAAAARSLLGEDDALPVLVAAVDDPMSEVRAAAIETLAASASPLGWKRVQAHLADEREWPSVTEAAIQYVLSHCQTDAVPTLMKVIFRAAAPRASQDELHNAARAVLALRRLDTAEARAQLRRLRASSGLPLALKTALEEPLPEQAPCLRAPQ